MRIDDNGDRDADYSILDLDPITGKFEVVAHYYGLHRKFSPVPGQKIHWPGGRETPPPDMPKCGFMENNPECLNHGKYLSCFEQCRSYECSYKIRMFRTTTSKDK